ncbi:CoA transferase [Variovorax sp. LjRoot290]|uniref:CaiB/BaiF CoA transferase family protein n=1 Tax=unclassified Variovorax TaxID=663243 RepID=UPI003ECFD642
MDLGQSFEGIRVCDLSQGIAGPHATMLLAQYGAEVVKVEPPEGDWGRLLGPRSEDHCAHSWHYNLGKKSIALDLKTAAGREILTKIASQCDIFIESFRPGVISRLGFSHEAVKAIRPDVIYVSVSGFGQTGPYSQRGTVDSLIQGFSGMMVMNRTAEGVPQRQGMVAADVVTGLYVFSSLTAALASRQQTGKGGYLDLSLMQSAAAFQGAKIAEFHASGGEPKSFYGPVGYLPTCDGGVSVSCRKEEHYVLLCQVLGRPALTDDTRFKSGEDRVLNEAVLMQVLARLTQPWTTAALLKALQDVGVLVERVQSYGEWLNNEQVLATGAYRWTNAGALGQLPLVSLPGINAPRPNRCHSPKIGQDSVAVCRQFGVDESLIDQALKRA